MKRPPPTSTRTDTLVPYTTLFRSQINKSNMIKVTAYSVSAEKAQRIENKLASVAILHQIEKRENASEETVASRTKRVAELREQVLEADERVATYRKRHGITQGMSDLTQMDRLASELAGARAVRADAEARSSTIGAASSAEIGRASCRERGCQYV